MCSISASLHPELHKSLGYQCGRRCSGIDGKTEKAGYSAGIYSIR